MFRIGALSLLVFFSLGATAHAQFDSVEVLSVTISPEYPRPYEVVSITPSSNQIDLSAATVKVYVNGKLVSTGSGTQSTPITVGGPGVRTTVLVTATVGGTTHRKQITIAPGDVSLVVDAASTAHPFYEGGLLVASQGRVRLIALADLRTSKGARMDPSKLIYTWKFGNQILQSDSGIGKSVLNAVAPVRYRDAQVSVTVASTDGSVSAQTSTLVAPVDPLIRMYHVDPLRGVDFNTALPNSFTLSGSEETLRGVAYFFGAKPTLLWSVNGQGSGGDDTVTVRSSGSGSGRANLSLSARLNETHQSVTKTLSVLFSGESGTNIFGF